MQIKFELVKEARSTGGDKYVAPDYKNFNIYFPQEISRAQGSVRSTITITIGD